MPIIENFRSTTVWRAFILNSLAASISIVVALMVKMHYTQYVDETGKIHKLHEQRNGSNVITFVATFIATFLSFTILHFIFGYGGGQIDTTERSCGSAKRSMREKRSAFLESFRT